jgi:hypothetical protein
MKRIVLSFLLLTTVGMASAQRLEAPDSVVLDLGVVSSNFSVNPQGPVNVYGNISVAERLYQGYDKSVWGYLTVGNTYNDFNRLFVDTGLEYRTSNLTLYASTRQGFFENKNFGNYGTSVRVGTRMRF